MSISGTYTLVLNVNGTNYSFADPHAVTALFDQLDGLNQQLTIWQQRTIDTQAQLDSVNAQITAMCTTPV